MRSGLVLKDSSPASSQHMHPSPRLTHALSYSPVVLVRPRYPENLGAVARAMRVSGFEDLVLVAPHALADPSHEQAIKLAVGSSDLLAKARVLPSLEAARTGCLSVATSARRGVSGILSPRELASLLLSHARKGQRAALIFGGERTGLRKAEVDACDVVCRIPMVGNEPSLNLAQAVTVVLYELLVATLARD